MQKKITPFLWFDGQAEEAINFYTNIFNNSKITMLNRAGKDGSVMSGAFELDGQQFMVLNGGPQFKFTEAISMFVDCKDQAEVDYFWEKLSAGGSIQQCGWLKDKFGVSWQIVPHVLGDYLFNSAPEQSQRVVNAMLQMKKLDVAGLTAAYEAK